MRMKLKAKTDHRLKLMPTGNTPRALTCLAALIALIGLSSTVNAESNEGGISGGGGGFAEIKMKSIRDELLTWVKSPGPSSLDFRKAHGLTEAEYRLKMKDILSNLSVQIGSISAEEESKTNDPDLKVRVQNEPKDCRGSLWARDGLPHILCIEKPFMDASSSDQYRMIHHEYAGLIGIEKNIGPNSDYNLSEQLTEYVEPQVTDRLGIKRKHKRELTGDTLRYWIIDHTRGLTVESFWRKTSLKFDEVDENGESIYQTQYMEQPQASKGRLFDFGSGYPYPDGTPSRLADRIVDHSQDAEALFKANSQDKEPLLVCETASPMESLKLKFSFYVGESESDLHWRLEVIKPTYFWSIQLGAKNLSEQGLYEATGHCDAPSAVGITRDEEFASLALADFEFNHVTLDNVETVYDLKHSDHNPNLRMLFLTRLFVPGASFGAVLEDIQDLSPQTVSVLNCRAAK